MTPEDVEDVARLTARAFGGSPEEEMNYARNTCKSDHLRAYVLPHQGEIIAVVSVDFSEAGRYLYGFCVDPGRQRMGYGARLLEDVLRRLMEEGDGVISLNVDSTNPGALALYRSRGFEIKATEQYFRVNSPA